MSTTPGQAYAATQGTVLTRAEVLALIASPGFDSYGETRLYVTPSDASSVGMVKSAYHVERALEDAVFYSITRHGGVPVGRA